MKKIISIFLTTFILLSLVGCGDKKMDYSIGSETDGVEEMQSDIPQSIEYSVLNQKGTGIFVNAKIYADTDKNWPVFSIDKKTLSVEDVKLIADDFFDNKEYVIFYDSFVGTANYRADRYEYLKKVSEELSDLDSSHNGWVYEEMRELENYYDEDYIDYYSGEKYDASVLEWKTFKFMMGGDDNGQVFAEDKKISLEGKHDGKYYRINFYDYGSVFVIKGCMLLGNKRQGFYDEDIKNINSVCLYSEVEAGDISADFLSSFALGNISNAGAFKVNLRQEAYASGKEALVRYETYNNSGYRVLFTRDYLGKVAEYTYNDTMSEYADDNWFIPVYHKDSEYSESISTREYISTMVSSDGVVDFTIYSPSIIKETKTDNIGLMEFDKINDIAKSIFQETADEIEAYASSANQRNFIIDEIKLGLYEIRYEDNSIVVVPTWFFYLSNTEFDEPPAIKVPFVMINALDGSIIQF